MRIGSLFSGGGGGDLGFAQSGHQIVFGAEIDKFARSVFRHHHPNTPIFHDVKDITNERIRNESIEFPNVIFGGSPCQDLSTSGRRAGLDGSKSSLFFEQIRIADELGSEFLIWENVTGAFSTNNGRDFAAVLGAITGFEPEPPKQWQTGGVCIGPKRNAVWRVLDLQGFGVPQRRRRIFIVANTGTVELGNLVEILFDTESGGRDFAPSRKAEQKVRADTDGRFATNCGGQLTSVVNPLSTANRFDLERQSFIVETNATVDVAGTLGASYHRNPGQQEMKSGLAAVVTIAPTKVTSTLPTINHLVPETAAGGQAAIIATFDEKYSGQYTITPNEHISTTLKVSSPPAIATDMFVRRLTPLECERLMGWPDGYTANGIDDNGNEISISDTQRYKICGNGIGSPVTKWIGERLNKLETGQQ